MNTLLCIDTHPQNGLPVNQDIDSLSEMCQIRYIDVMWASSEISSHSVIIIALIDTNDSVRLLWCRPPPGEASQQPRLALCATSRPPRPPSASQSPPPGSGLGPLDKLQGGPRHSVLGTSHGNHSGLFGHCNYTRGMGQCSSKKEFNFLEVSKDFI